MKPVLTSSPWVVQSTPRETASPSYLESLLCSSLGMQEPQMKGQDEREYTPAIRWSLARTRAAIAQWSLTVASKMLVWPVCSPPPLPRLTRAARNTENRRYIMLWG